MRLAGSRLGKESESCVGADWEVLRDDERIIDCMIRHGARFDQQDPSGKTLLHYAAILGCESRVHWVFERKDWRKLDCADKDGRTPLWWACEEKQQAVLRLLLGQKVDCNNGDNDDWTPIEQAAALCDHSTMELLFAAGAECRQHLLLKLFSCWHGSYVDLNNPEQYQCLKIALRHGADPSVKDENGQSLLHCALSKNNMMATEWLFENQCLDINTRDHQGRLALHVAAQCASSTLVEYLLDNGSQVTINVADRTGSTALHMAVQKGDEETARFLLKRGSVIGYRAQHRRTALRVAVLFGYKDVAKALLEAGADPSLQDKYLETPREIAAMGHREEILAMLNESHDRTPDSTSDFSVDSDYERWQSDNSQVED